MRERFLPPSALRDYVIGVDESGVGAIAGPFTVTAFMSKRSRTAAIKGTGARDSKQLTHAQRQVIADRLLDHELCIASEQVAPDYKDQREAWRVAVARAVMRCLRATGVHPDEVDVCIDGLVDRPLRDLMRQSWHVKTIWLTKGENRQPQIAAASIFAKMWRSELMYDAHVMFPMYGWSNATGHGNDGYGTPDHFHAITKHGVCALHRRVRPLLRYFGDQVPDGQISTSR